MASEPFLKQIIDSPDRSWNPRSLLKRILERLASSSSFIRTLGIMQRRGAMVLAYHNVVPDSESITGETPLHLRFGAFRSHLDAIERHFDVCSLEQMLRLDSAETPRRLRVAITFDDAYAGTLKLAVPELVRRGHSAVIFAPSGLMGKPSFWWDTYDISPSERSEICLTRLKGVAEGIDSWARGNGRTAKPPGPSQRPGTVDELIAAARMPGIDVAVHTVNHPNLAELDQDEVTRELQCCRKDFESWGIEVSPFVAYPYGLSSPLVRDVVKGGTWIAGFAIEGGTFRNGTSDPWHLPRVAIPAQASAENVLLRILGVIPS